VLNVNRPLHWGEELQRVKIETVDRDIKLSKNKNYAVVLKRKATTGFANLYEVYINW